MYFKWIKDLYIRPKNNFILLENYVGEKVHNIGLHNDFLDMMPKNTGNKQNQKIDK
jgi:hypothetical protein